MLKTFKIIPFIFLSSILINCEKKNEDISISKANSIYRLLEQANNVKLDKEKRIKYADSTYSLIRTKKFDSINKIQLQNVILIYYNLNKKEKLLRTSKELIFKSAQIKDFETIGTTYINLGSFHFSKFQIDSAFYYYDKAEKNLIKLKEHPYLEHVLFSKANILWAKKDFRGAENLSISALKIALINKDFLLICNCYALLGNSLLGLNNYSKALEYYHKAIQTSENLKSEPNYLSSKLMPINYISNVYQKQKEYKKSIQYAQKGLIFKGIKNKEPLIYCYLTNNLAYSKFKLGDTSSLNQFNETLKIGDSIKSVPIQITSKMYLGEFYLLAKDTQKANFYLKEAQIAAHKNNIFDDELKIVQLLEQANPSQSSYYSNRYIELNDSLQNVERATRDKFARIEFETDEITSQKNVVEKKNNYLLNSIWVIIGFSILTLLVLVLWFMNKSQKAKTRELLLKQEQQKANQEIYQLMIDQQQKMEEGKNSEKQRISLDLHDGVMGKLAAVRLNLYAALYKANLIDDEVFVKQIDEIQEVEKEIRTIAHDLNSNLFSDNANFIGIVKELFTKIENHSQIHFTLQVSDAVNWDLVTITIKIHLYRILQEALQNIEKYAVAQNVIVLMSLTETNEIHISISDDGKGFNTNQKKSGIGIKNMKTRATELKGTFTIQSEIKKGTQINLTIPF